MQIWRTTLSAPGTSRMKARLVRLCFNFFDRQCFQCLLRPRSALFCFVLPMSFCVPECHQKGVKSSTAEKCFFFQFPRSPLGGKQTKERSSRSPKELSKFFRYISGWKILENVALAASRRHLVRCSNWLQQRGQLTFNRLVITPWYLFLEIPCDWTRT